LAKFHTYTTDLQSPWSFLHANFASVVVVTSTLTWRSQKSRCWSS